MAEDHSKYMPHHPKPKFGGSGKKASLHDPMIRQRAEPTSHEGSGGSTSTFGDYQQGYYPSSPMAQSTPAPDAGGEGFM